MNLRLCPALLVAFWSLSAQAADPVLQAPLAGVKEVVLQYPRFSDIKAASICGLGREETSNLLVSALKNGEAPIIPAATAKPADPNVARIDLIPEVSISILPSGECASWVSITAQSEAALRLSPVPVVRKLVVTYWRYGNLIVSMKEGHPTAVNGYFQKLATAFAKQYKLDQPPPLPDFEEKGPVDLTKTIK
jgi:hypothetical protein